MSDGERQEWREGEIRDLFPRWRDGVPDLSEASVDALIRAWETEAAPQTGWDDLWALVMFEGLHQQYLHERKQADGEARRRSHWAALMLFPDLIACVVDGFAAGHLRAVWVD